MSVWRNLLSASGLQAFEQAQQQPVRAVPSPFDSWNKCSGDDGGGRGPALGWTVTVGGNPGHGKSLLAQNFALGAIRTNHRVAFVSFEMSADQIAARFYAMFSGVPVAKLERGRFMAQDFRQEVRGFFREFTKTHTRASFFVNESPQSGLRDLERALEFNRTEHGAEVFVVDYVQLVGTGDEESVTRQVSECINLCRQFAMSHKVLVLGLSQYNRYTSRDYTQSPTMQSLHGGMMLEAGSDQVVLLDHSRYLRQEHYGRTFLLLAKNRHGRTGEIAIEWDYRTLTVRQGLPDEEGLWPQRSGGGR